MTLAPETLTDEQIERLSEFRQGDVLPALDTHMWLADGNSPTTPQSRAAAEAGRLSAMHEETPRGHAILTQTCDLVPRGHRYRPFAVLAPVVRLKGHTAAQGSRGRLIRYAHVPAYSDGFCFADLDRIVTVETGVLLSHERRIGLSTDQQRNRFAQAVARKFNRFAFPDDVPASLDKWRKRVMDKHDKADSSEGRLFAEAADVRILADRDWNADELRISVILLFEPGFLPPDIDPDAEQQVGEVDGVSGLSAAVIARQLCDGVDDPNRGALLCERLQNIWSSLCTRVGVVDEIDFKLESLEGMTAGEYRDSFSLDLEFLSHEASE